VGEFLKREIERRPDLIVPEDRAMDTQFARWANLSDKEHATYQAEVEHAARDVLERQPDLKIPTGRGELVNDQFVPELRPAKEVIDGLDQDLRIGQMLKKCLMGG